MFKRKKGFTLLELMIVVIIIGILASLAIPRFIAAADKARRAAAQQMLSSIRGSQMRYNLEYDEYTQIMSRLDADMTTSSDWTVDDLTDNPDEDSDDAVIGLVTHSSGTTYTIQVDGDVE